MIEDLRFETYKDRLVRFLSVNEDGSGWNKVRDAYTFKELYRPLNLMNIIDYFLMDKVEIEVSEASHLYFELRRPVIRYFSGYPAVQLLSSTDFSREGLIMRNCLRNYLDLSMRGEMEIFSLFDEETLLPLFNIALQGGRLVKVSGPMNGPGPKGLDVAAGLYGKSVG